MFIDVEFSDGGSYRFFLANEGEVWRHEYDRQGYIIGVKQDSKLRAMQHINRAVGDLRITKSIVERAFDRNYNVLVNDDGCAICKHRDGGPTPQERR